MNKIDRMNRILATKIERIYENTIFDASFMSNIVK